MGDWVSIPGSGRSPGEGHGNPLQYCCLKNPMDRRARGIVTPVHNHPARERACIFVCLSCSFQAFKTVCFSCSLPWMPSPPPFIYAFNMLIQGPIQMQLFSWILLWSPPHLHQEETFSLWFYKYICTYLWASLVTQMVKNLLAMWEIWFRSLGQEDPLEKEMVTHSNILAWEIPWIEAPVGL